MVIPIKRRGDFGSLAWAKIGVIPIQYSHACLYFFFVRELICRVHTRPRVVDGGKESRAQVGLCLGG